MRDVEDVEAARRSRLLRWAVVASVVAVWVLLGLAVAAQPAFDLRHDLVSGLAARGAEHPALGRAAITAVGLGHLMAAALLATRRARLAAGAAAVAAVCAVGVAAVPITCPRGARGCSGPDSGRASPLPVTDVVHRDLVAGFEAATVVLAVAVSVHLWRHRRQVLATAAVLLGAVLSPWLLWRQQGGADIGWWQLSWLATGCALLLLVSALPSSAAGRQTGTDSSGTRAPLRNR